MWVPFWRGPVDYSSWWILNTHTHRYTPETGAKLIWSCSFDLCCFPADLGVAKEATENQGQSDNKQPGTGFPSSHTAFLTPLFVLFVLKKIKSKLAPTLHALLGTPFLHRAELPDSSRGPSVGEARGEGSGPQDHPCVAPCNLLCLTVLLAACGLIRLPRLSSARSSCPGSRLAKTETLQPLWGCDCWGEPRLDPRRACVCVCQSDWGGGSLPEVLLAVFPTQRQGERGPDSAGRGTSFAGSQVGFGGYLGSLRRWLGWGLSLHPSLSAPSPPSFRSPRVRPSRRPRRGRPTSGSDTRS